MEEKAGTFIDLRRTIIKYYSERQHGNTQEVLEDATWNFRSGPVTRKSCTRKERIMTICTGGARIYGDTLLLAELQAT